MAYDDPPLAGGVGRLVRDEPVARAEVERDELERDEVERERDEAGLDAVERDDAGLDAVERDEAERVVRDDAGLDAVDFEVVDFARDEAALGFAAAVLGAEVLLAGFADVARRVAGFAAEAAGLTSFDSSEATRRESASISLRRPRTSSSTFMSSIVSRMRVAACATSSTSSRVRFCVPAAPSLVAWNVRSTALRTASTASAAPPACLSFFAFLSFFAMAASLISRRVPGEPVHLRPHAEVAERVLAPGDPGRALRLAQLLLDTPKMLNHNRGLWGYTGVAADGDPMTIQATGLGGPSTALVVEDLIALGARRIVRVGTCAGLGPALGSLVIAETVLAEDGTSRALGAAGPLTPDPGLSAALTDGARGLVVAADLPYEAERWAATGAIAVDLAAGALLAAAARHGVAAACVLLVAASGDARLDPEALERAEEGLGRAGAAALSLDPPMTRG